ncbi:MAG TPA: hypothetical protein PLI95_07240 [Polyangiaceae bacterium]|nr:hypothetical protein [Polyangiaceae bacterium]
MKPRAEQLSSSRSPIRLLRLLGAWAAGALMILPAALVWYLRAPRDVSADPAIAGWNPPKGTSASSEVSRPGDDVVAATGVPPLLAREDDLTANRRNFVEDLQHNEYLATPVRPLSRSAAQAGGSPSKPERPGVVREVSGRDCDCARLDPACACLPTAPACPVSGRSASEPCRYF